MDYRKLIVESGLRMANSGLTVETWGNISARNPETGLVYLTPSAMQYDTITVDDVVVAELDGKIVQGTRKPTIETGMHLAVYRARKDVNAVIHTHPTYSMVYSCQGKDIPLFMDEAAQIMGDTCHTTPYALPGSQELADAVVAALGEKANTCLVRSHGAVAVGGDMDGAFRTCKVLEIAAHILYMIEAAGGKPIPISDENIAIMQDFVKNHYGQGKD